MRFLHASSGDRDHPVECTHKADEKNRDGVVFLLGNSIQSDSYSRKVSGRLLDALPNWGNRRQGRLVIEYSTSPPR